MSRGFLFNEYYLYSEKGWEFIPIGTETFLLENAILQNAPVVITSSGWEITSPNDPWAILTASGKYDQVAYGSFTIDSNGFIDNSKNEFCIVPYASGTILFNKTLTENVYVEYEAGPSGYYVLNTINMDPMRGEVESGFLQLSPDSIPGSIYITTSVSSINADGYNSAVLTATLSDSNYDKLYNKQVVFELRDLSYDTGLGSLAPYGGSVLYTDPSGYITQVIETTDGHGNVYTTYTPKQFNTGRQIIRAYSIDASGVYDEVEVLQYYIEGSVFTLDESELDSLDYLT